MKSIPPPTADLTFPVQVEPMAARLLKGARTVVIETAVALQVAFGDKRTALTAAAAVGAAAQLVAAPGHSPIEKGPAVVTLAVPEGATHVALVLASDSPAADYLAARQGARLVHVSVQ